MPMTIVHLRLPDEAIRLLDELKGRYPQIAGKPSRTSVVLGLLSSCQARNPLEEQLRQAVTDWIDEQGIGQAV